MYQACNLQIFRKLLFVSVLAMNLGITGSCALLQKITSLVPAPEANLSDIQFSGLDMKNLHLLIAVDIKNPYPVNIPKMAIDLGLKLDGVAITGLQSTSAKGIASSQTRTIKFKTSIPFLNIARLYKNMDKDQVKFLMGLEGNMDLMIPVDKLPEIFKKGLEQSQKISNSKRAANSYRFDIKMEKKIPAIVPEIEISNFEFERPEIINTNDSGGVNSYLDKLLDFGRSPGSAIRNGLKNVDLDLKISFDLNLQNQAKTKLGLDALNYTLFLNNSMLLKGKSGQSKFSDEKSIIHIETSFPLRSITSSLAGVISRGSAAVRLQADSNLKIEDWNQSIPVPFKLDKTQVLSWKSK